MSPPPAPETQIYDVPCPNCGTAIRGRRTEGYQAVRCGDCGDGIFVLPRSPFREPPPMRMKVRTSRSGQGPTLGKSVSSSNELFAAAPDMEAEIEWTDPIPSAFPHARGDDESESEGEGEAADPNAPALEIEWVDEPAPSSSSRPASSQSPPKTRPSPSQPRPRSPQAPSSPPRAQPRPARSKPEPEPEPETESEEDSGEHDPFIVVPDRPRSRGRGLLIFAAVALVLISTVVFRVWQNRKQSYPAIAAKGWSEGIPALEAGQFDLAKALLAPAAEAVDGLNGEVEHALEIRQAAEEADIYASLAGKSLEDLISEAARANRDAWPKTFRALYQGQAIIFEGTIQQGREGREIGYRICVGPGPKPDKAGAIDFQGFRLFESLKPKPGERLAFAARLEAVELDEQTGEWRVRLQPDSGVVLTYRSALEFIGWPSGDDEAALGTNAAPVDPGDLSGPLQNSTRAQILARLGKPNLVERAAVQGNLTEQWVYLGATAAQRINFQRDSGSGQVTVAAQYSFP